VYADTKSFFEAEIKRLTAENIGLDKQLTFDKKAQSTKEIHPNWQKELDAFLTIDLHKNNVKGRLHYDSVVIADTAYQLIYNSNDTKLNLRKCVITFQRESNKIVEMIAEFETQNNLYQSTKTFWYHTKIGYHINGSQNIRLGNNNVDYNISGMFVKPSASQ
jgi:predicted nucleic-acid-binding protein